jgi:hypothetical protein
MHLLRDGTIEFKHGNTKFITSQMVGDLLENHSFPEHERRLFLDAEHPVLNQSYDEVYLMLGDVGQRAMTPSLLFSPLKNK